jgi:DNA-binding transcriptional regulator YiaG
MSNVLISNRIKRGEKITTQELIEFMTINGISEKELAEIFGVTTQAVRLWVTGSREFTVTNSRLIRMFQKYPKLLKEF